MSALSIQPTYPIFTDIDGQPLEAGYIWIGTANLNPITNPINVYWDAALTQPAAQPIRTVSGYPSNAGTPARLYVNSDYSIQVQNKNATVVYSAPQATERYSSNLISFVGFKGQVGTVADLADDDGSDWIGFEQAGANAVARSVQDKLREYAVSVKDFGAVGDGVADDRAAINAAFTEVFSRESGTVYFPSGTYRITGSIGATGTISGQINLAIIGEQGTVIECDPAVFDNYAFYLQITNLETLYVSGFKVNCNDKVNIGFFVTSLSSNAIQDVVIENCRINDCNSVNNAGSTRSVRGISISSSGWGFRATVRNCFVNGCSRDHWTGSQACQGIAVTGFETVTIEGNTVENITHNSQQLQDADGIVVFSFNDSGDYRKTNALIQNNNIQNCDGRFIKLQTEGQVTVTGNYCALTAAMTLINNWKGIDSQVADMDCHHNTFFIDDNWSGGASANLVSMQTPASATVQYNNEGFFQRFNSNVVEVRKEMPYFCIPAIGSTQTNQYLEICDNIVNYPLTLNTVSSSAAFTQFIYLNDLSFVSAASMAGNVYWLIARNRVSTYNFIVLDTTQEDYTGKWYVQLEDNFKASIGFTREIFYLGASSNYTSNIKISNNMIGQSNGIFTWPNDPSDWLNECDLPMGDSLAGAISPAPANYRNGRFYKKGNILGVEVVAAGVGYHYISQDNGANWYQV